MSQFHFDPATYLSMIREDVARHDELQAEAVHATEGIVFTAILELGTGTGVTARRILEQHPSAELVGKSSVRSPRTSPPSSLARVSRPRLAGSCAAPSPPRRWTRRRRGPPCRRGPFPFGRGLRGIRSRRPARLSRVRTLRESAPQTAYGRVAARSRASRRSQRAMSVPSARRDRARSCARSTFPRARRTTRHGRVSRPGRRPPRRSG